jgi:colanic acid biosynthesis glycosyl transferase WcaI
LLFKVEKYILKRADVVSSISEGMIKKIEKKYPREVVFFPNWVDTSLFFPIHEKAQLKIAFGFDKLDKIVLYSGAIGEKQGLETILQAAKSLESFDHLKFVICGSGPYKEKLMQLKGSQNLGNVFFLPLQPFEKLNSFLNMADLHLVLQKANAADLVMPSKLTAILAVGGSAIITANEGSSLHNVVAKHKMGILINPEDPAVLTAAIQLALESGDSLIEQNARNYARQYLSIEEIFKNYTNHL